MLRNLFSANIINKESIIINCKNMLRSREGEGGILPEVQKQETNKYLKERGIDSKDLESRDTVVGGYLKEKGFSFDKETDKEYGEPTENNVKIGLRKLLDLYGMDIDDMPSDIRARLNIKIDDEGNELSKREELNSFEGMKGNIFSMLELDNETETAFYKILGDKLGVADIKSRVEELIEQCHDVVKAAKGDKKFLVHGDLGIKSVHASENDAKFSDWDWATISDNEALALVFDYGNWRGRAAGEPKLQEAMDEAIMDEFKERGNPELGKAIVDLATLRTSLKFIKYRLKEGASFTEKQAAGHEKDFKKSLGVKEEPEV